MKWLVIPWIIILAGCAAPTMRTVQVKVPVSVPCKVPKISVPDWALDHVVPSDNDYVWARAALVEIGQHVAYETRLTAVIVACQ